MPTVQSRRPTHAATAPPVVATAVSESPARRRLAPEARATQILDVAARLLMDEGFTEVSMERMGREAGVSKALIYNYFPNRNDLLRALLEREVGALRQTQVREVAAAENFHDLVRRTTRLYIEHMQARGLPIETDRAMCENIRPPQTQGSAPAWWWAGSSTPEQFSSRPWPLTPGWRGRRSRFAMSIIQSVREDRKISSNVSGNILFGVSCLVP